MLVIIVLQVYAYYNVFLVNKVNNISTCSVFLHRIVNN
jgi:hypothetical protein